MKGDSNAVDTEGRFERTVYSDPIGKVKLAKLRTAQIKKWRAALDMKPGSANRYLSALKATLNYAVASRYVDAGRVIEWHNVKPQSITDRRDLYLARDQRRALIEALPDHARPFMRALSPLPLRPGALASCTVGDLKGGSLHIRHDFVPAQSRKDEYGQIAMDTKQDQRAFGPLVDECRARGIGRTVAFELAKDGLIETFSIGRRRYVKLDSLDTLPDRLAVHGSGASA